MENASSLSLTDNENLVIEEREEVILSDEKGHCLRKTHFLKPFVTSINGGSVAELPLHNECLSVFPSKLLKVFSLRGSFSGFWVADSHFLSWLGKMEALHAPTWRKAGIFEAIKASTYNITKNSSLILSVSEKWCPQTKSFVFPWGEATITLEDVMALLGFSVLGFPVFAPLENSEMRDSVKKLQKARLEIMRKDGFGGQRSWISSFIGRGDQMEHEAFLILWLSLYVFPGNSQRRISRHVVPIAIRLARGERIALAPAVLAILYRDLGRIREFVREDCAGKFQMRSLFKLVQVWTWERFKNIKPKAREIPEGGPRIAQWDGLQQISRNVKLTFDDFDWRPYTEPLKNWNPLQFYLEKAMWVTVDKCIDDEFASFVRCVRVSQLAGDSFVEDYHPNRVARQFGLAQELPGLVTHHRNFSEKEAWDDYNKPLDGLKLYMPSRLDRGSVTARYQAWWLKSISEFLASIEMQKESFETSNARETSDHHDEDDVNDSDVCPKVLPLSQVVQRLEKGFPEKRRRSRMRRLKNGKRGKLMKSLVSSGWKMNKISDALTNKKSNYKSVQMERAYENDDENSMDDEDLNMTIAQMIRSRKDYSNAEKNVGDAIILLGKRNRRYQVVESDDSEPSQKHASIEIKQRSVEDYETASKRQKTMQTCDDFEVDVIGNNVDKESMIHNRQGNGSILQSIGEDGTKKAECLLQEDGEKKRCTDKKLCSEVKKNEDVDERLKQRELVMNEIALKLEARMMKVKTTFEKVRKWKIRQMMKLYQKKKPFDLKLHKRISWRQRQ